MFMYVPTSYMFCFCYQLLVTILYYFLTLLSHICSSCVILCIVQQNVNLVLLSIILSTFSFKSLVKRRAPQTSLYKGAIDESMKSMKGALYASSGPGYSEVYEWSLDSSAS